MLDPIHHQGLRLALGAFRTSPTASLYVEADEPSLNTRREKLSLQYAIRIAENNSNPAHDVTFQPNYMDLYESKPNFIKSFGVRILPVLESANINFDNIDKTFTPNVPAWCINKPKLLFDLHSSKTLESPYHLVAVSGAHFTQGTILIVILVSSGSAKSRTHQSAVGGFLVTRRGWPGRLRACRIWTFINSV